MEIPSLFHNRLTLHSRYSTLNTQFDWQLIRSFLAALDQGSLLGAARVLGSTQPTIGRHIAELESQLGVVLFERTGRGLLPTEMALRLADSARTMEGSALQLARSVSGRRRTASRAAVRITASQPVACFVMPRGAGADARWRCRRCRWSWCRATR